MGLGRLILAAVVAAGLAGCVTASNTLSVDQVATLRFSGVNVMFAPDAQINWGDGERAFATAKGQPDSDTLAKTPEGQAYLRNAIASKLKTAMERQLAWSLVGTRPVRLEVRITNVTVASPLQRVIVGGHHTMLADVTLVDARTGAVIVPYAGQSTTAMAGQGIGGVMLDAAMMGAPIDRVINNYADQYGNWLMRRSG
jgi:hypothetical protein